MYKPGDHVFYPKGGVFVIEQESQKDIAGHSISFFDLISSDAKTRISIPKANVDRVGVRKLVTEQEFDKQVRGWIPDIKISKLHHKNRKSRFETMRQTGTFSEMGSVIVTIHYLINKTKATFEEKRMYDQIRKRLVNEIEIIKSMNPSSAETLLQGALDVAIKREPPKELEELGESETEGAATTEATDASTSESSVPKEADSKTKQQPEAAKTKEQPETAKPKEAKKPASPAKAKKEPAATKAEPAKAKKEPAATKAEPAKAKKEPAATKAEPAKAKKKPAAAKAEPSTEKSTKKTSAKEKAPAKAKPKAKAATKPRKPTPTKTKPAAKPKKAAATAG
jgi:RNA polymerase-interacting CarD/CdnL/TRCF family regulator